MPRKGALFWVHKTGQSPSLSHSEDDERISVFSQAQRASRNRKSKNDSTIEKAEGIQRKPPSPKRHLSPTPARSARERRSIEFFLDATVHKIITLHRDRVFWTATIPCLAQHYDALRHLVVAIATTHELMNHSDAPSLDIYALIQCNKAVKMLRSSGHWHPAILVVSCILVSAFSLLRCDHAQAELSIESGMKMLRTQLHSSDLDPFYAEGQDFRRVLEHLHSQHGYKLWASDMTFQFEKSRLTSNALVIEPISNYGPFTDADQVLKAFRSIMFDVVAKTMRNLARGVCIEPLCALAQDTLQQLSNLVFYWQQLYDSLSHECEGFRADLEQARIGIAYAYLVFRAKVIGPREEWFNAYPDVCQEILRLADKLIAARCSGHRVTYVDKMVNGVIFSFGMSSGDLAIQKRSMDLLRSQVSFEDGLINWLRAAVIQVVATVIKEEEISNPESYVVLAGLSCTAKPKTIRMEYTYSTSDATTHFASFPVDWEPWFDREVTAEEVGNVLQGMMAAYRMYGKPHPSQASHGYVREMYYCGRPVPVCGELDELSKLTHDGRT